MPAGDDRWLDLPLRGVCGNAGCCASPDARWHAPGAVDALAADCDCIPSDLAPLSHDLLWRIRFAAGIFVDPSTSDWAGQVHFFFSDGAEWLDRRPCHALACGVCRADFQLAFEFVLPDTGTQAEGQKIARFPGMAAPS